MDYTADTITFYRGKYDPYRNYVRVTLWVTNDSPQLPFFSVCLASLDVELADARRAEARRVHFSSSYAWTKP